MDDTKAIKILVIDTGCDPRKVEKFEFTKAEKELAKTTVLTTMNRMGKNSEALVKFGESLIVYSHTAARGPSKELFPAKVHYHPLAHELV